MKITYKYVYVYIVVYIPWATTAWSNRLIGWDILTKLSCSFTDFKSLDELGDELQHHGPVIRADTTAAVHYEDDIGQRTVTYRPRQQSEHIFRMYIFSAVA